MHTVMVLAAGMLLLAAFVVIGQSLKLSAGTAAIGFVPFWFLAAALNMWIGVTRANYTTAQEFPLFILNFGLPAVAAMIIWWRNARR